MATDPIDPLLRKCPETGALCPNPICAVGCHIRGMKGIGMTWTDIDRPPNIRPDPAVMALIAKLPPPGTAWSWQARSRWIGAMSAVLAMLYPRSAT